MSSAATKKKVPQQSPVATGKVTVEKSAKARLNADIPVSEMEMLQTWADNDGVTLNSIIRQMIKYAAFMREVEADKSQKLLVEKDGKYERIRFM